MSVLKREEIKEFIRNGINDNIYNRFHVNNSSLPTLKDLLIQNYTFINKTESCKIEFLYQLMKIIQNNSIDNYTISYPVQQRCVSFIFIDDILTMISQNMDQEC